MNRRDVLAMLGGAAVAAMPGVDAMAGKRSNLFADDNLWAWCIVPFDAKMRGPEDRAAMMKGLGFRHFAYDWRAEHLPQLDRELDALQTNGIGLDAFWFPAGADPEKEAHVHTILDFLRRRKVKTQLWLSTGVQEQGTTQEQRVEMVGKTVRWVAEEAGKLDCKVGLYNHGGWYGEPENQIEVIEHVKLKNVGIVYNWHHGHPHIDRFPELMRKMKPHLLALNINGMRKEGPKILPVGQGDLDEGMLRTVVASGYRGPIGVLGHRAEVDAELALRENLDGLKKLRPKLQAPS